MVPVVLRPQLLGAVAVVLVLAGLVQPVPGTAAAAYACGTGSGVPWATLNATLRASGDGGLLLLPSSPRWAHATARFYNNTVAHPLAVVLAATAADCAVALRFARIQRLCVCPKSSGHSYAGLSVMSQRLVIDVAGINHLRRGPAPLTIEAGPGVNLAQLVNFTEPLGVFLPWGGCHSVALGGYLQGGGQGNANRLLGVGADQVLAVTLVTATGEVVTADPTTNPELFWALRGGGGPGGNFGLVASYTLRVYPAPPAILRFSLGAGRGSRRRLAEQFFLAAESAPREFGAGIIWGGGPDGGVEVSGWWLGDPGEGVEYLAAALNCSNLTVHLDSMSIWAASRLDFAGSWGLLPFSVSIRGHSAFFPPSASPALVDALFAAADATPAVGLMATMSMFLLGGRVADIPDNATAFVHRKWMGDFSVIGVWEDPAHEVPLSKWADATYAALQPLLAPEVYQNAVDLTLPNWQELYYGRNLARLKAVKQAWDPDNFFQFPQSLPLQ